MTVAVVDNLPPEVSIVVDGAPTLVAGTSLTLDATAYDVEVAIAYGSEVAASDVLTYNWSVTSASSGAATTDIDFDLDTSGVQSSLMGATASLRVPAEPVGTIYNIRVAVTDLAAQTTNADYSLVIASGAVPIFIFDDHAKPARRGTGRDRRPELAGVGPPREHGASDAGCRARLLTPGSNFVLTAVISPRLDRQANETPAVPVPCYPDNAGV